jgi:hypothetical protein
MATRRTKPRTPYPLPLFPVVQDRDPDVLDVQATARMLGISTHAVYALYKKGELPGRKSRAAGSPPETRCSNGLKAHRKTTPLSVPSPTAIRKRLPLL